MRLKVVLLAILLCSQFATIGLVNGASEYSAKYAIDYDSDFENVASCWVNSTWNPHGAADNWIKVEDGIVTLYYRANRTDWGNTEVYQGKKPAFEIEKSLRFRDFFYREGTGGLNLTAKVKRDMDPIWQGPPLSENSPYPQANIGIYLWLEVQGWNYDNWTKTSSLVIDIYFDSRYQNQTTMKTEIRQPRWSYPPTTTPYDPQIHAGYAIGTLPLNEWQTFDVDVGALIDQTLQKCRNNNITLPSNKVFVKFFGVYVDSFSAAIQASFDSVLLRDTSYEQLLANIASLQVEIENIKNFMYIPVISAIVFLGTTVYLAFRKPKKKLPVKLHLHDSKKPVDAKSHLGQQCSKSR